MGQKWYDIFGGAGAPGGSFFTLFYNYLIIKHITLAPFNAVNGC